MEYVVGTIYILCQVLLWAIFIRVILSWFKLAPDNPLLGLLNQITEPILAPLRRVIPRAGMFDLTPMAAIFLLLMISRLVYLLPQ